MKNIFFKLTIVFMMSFLVNSCEKDYLETIPTDQVAASLAVESAENGYIVINGIHRAMYDRFDSNTKGGIGAIKCMNDLLGDDLVNNATNNTWGTHYQWAANVSDTDTHVNFEWSFFYHLIGNANIVIGGIDEATGETALKDYVKGQALVYRAYSHYKLVQLFGSRYRRGEVNSQLGIPYKLNAVDILVPRNTVEEVYTLINDDLDTAILLLDGKPRENKSHINKNVAQALKARVALTQGLWDVAIANAIDARSGFTLMNQDTYKAGFKSDAQGNSEFMWAVLISPDQARKFTDFGAYMSRNFSGNAVRGNPKSITKELFDQIPPNDVRRLLWDPSGLHTTYNGLITFTTHKKFKYTSQKFLVLDNGDSRVDIPLIRAAEMYLIEAEANARKGSASEALARTALFNLVSTRDLTYVLSTNSEQALIDEIMLHRRIELWGEGYRFYDLKRLNQDLVRYTGAANSGAHQLSFIGNVSFVAAGDKRWQLLIPKQEIDANPLVLQNPL